MSFSNDVKKELYSIEEKECCKKVFLFAVVSFSNIFSSTNALAKLKNKNLAEKLAEDISGILRIVVDIEISKYNTGKRNCKFYSLCISDKSNRNKALDFLNNSSNCNFLDLYEQNMKNKCCLATFLRSVFLVCASIKNPSKGYQIEFHMPSKERAEFFINIIKDLEEISISPILYRRKGNWYVYIKKSEQIADFLAFIGANISAMNFIQVKILKEIRGYANRTTNFEAANIEKTIASSVEQINAIKKINKIKGLKFLNENLRYIAILRLNNPELSLNELTKLSSKSISKSTLARRLNKIVEVAKEI